MKLKRITYIVLGAFLILSGLVSLLSGLRGMGVIIAILAVAAGILILMSSPGISHSIGWMLAAIYLITLGLIVLLGFSFSGIGIIMAILALAAGFLLLLRAPSIKKYLGFFLFCVWLILVGLLGLINGGDIGLVVAIIAVASGVLLILNK